MRKNKKFNYYEYFNKQVQLLNESKIFAGVMIIIINISSKFVTFKLSKTMEAYLKFTFSRDILVFAITWMGTRDIYISIFITILFVFVADFLMNENSRFCCLPTSFIDKHVALLEGFNAANPSQEVKYKIINHVEQNAKI